MPTATLGGLLLPVADRHLRCNWSRREACCGSGPAAGPADRGGAVRLIEEHGPTVVGEPEIPHWPDGRSTPPRPGRSRFGWTAASLAGWRGGQFQVQPGGSGSVAVALEVPRARPLRPGPAIARADARPSARRPPSEGRFLRAVPWEVLDTAAVHSNNGRSHWIHSAGLWILVPDDLTTWEDFGYPVPTF
jgi:hypothetical protein